MTLANPNYFTGNPLERLSEDRGNHEWFQKQLDHPKAKMIAIWRGHPLMETSADNEKLSPLWLSPAAKSEFPTTATLILLGFKDSVPYFAIDASKSSDTPEAAPFADIGHYTFMRDLAGKTRREDLAILGQAVWLVDWHRRHQYCANCGMPSETRAAGASRHCAACETDHFPRTDPVAIVLIVNGENCLLGRGIQFPSNMFSALAGFLEAGETLEECAAREVHEEVGVTVTEIDYIFSQPWPFPNSLMVGFIAQTNDTEFSIDTKELAEARWVSRSEIRELIAGHRRDDIWIPPKFAIARQLLERWAAD